MIPSMIFSIAALILLGWVLRTNSNDRKRFERELEGVFQEKTPF